MPPTTKRSAPSVARGRRPNTLPRHERIELLLAETKRSSVPIRRLFVQQGNNPDTRPGPLAEFLTGHDDRGLEAYLFVHAMAAGFPWDCKLPSEAWVGALGLAENAAMDSAKAAVSKIMRRLEQRKLITRTRSKRLSDITLCKEDGSGDKYVHPIESGEPYLQLPHSYWLEGHYRSLHLPAKIMLLIALSLQAGFNLPYNRARDWYGLSEDSAKEGLHELRKRGLLAVESTWVAAPRSPTGWTERLEYTLQGSFSRERRRKAELVASGESSEVPAE